jgi:plastocyanin
MHIPLTTRHAVIAGAAAAVLGLAACGGTDAATAPTTASSSSSSSSMTTMQMPAASAASVNTAPVATDTVAIQSFAFGPATVSIRPGTRVTWTQDDEDQHTVTADDGSFTSSPLVTGQTYTHTFTAPATYHYHCSIHPFMHGTVVVTNG